MLKVILVLSAFSMGEWNTIVTNDQDAQGNRFTIETCAQAATDFLNRVVEAKALDKDIPAVSADCRMGLAQ